MLSPASAVSLQVKMGFIARDRQNAVAEEAVASSIRHLHLYVCAERQDAGCSTVQALGFGFIASP